MMTIIKTTVTVGTEARKESIKDKQTIS